MIGKFQLSHLLNGVAFGALISMSANPAAAQTASTDEANNEDPGGNVIIVTARGREESLLEVPVSISSLSQDQLDSRGVSDIENLSNYTPGFQFENTDGQAGGRSSSNFTFRGIRQQVGGAASRVGAIFYDGSYISQGAGVVQPIDVERVEVIKGPQNAQFARNTFAGAVNIIPKLPGDELEVSGLVEVGFGTGSGEEVSFRTVTAVGGPITDQIGVRIATSYERVGADYEYQNGDPNGRENNYSIFGTLVFDPTDNFRVKASGYYVDASDTSGSQSVNSSVAAGDCDRTFSGAVVGIDGVETPFTTDLSNSTITTFCGRIPDASEFQASPTGDFGIASAPANIVPFTGLFPEGWGNEYRVWKANLDFVYETDAGHTIKALASLGESSLVGINDVFYGESGDPTAPSPNVQFFFPFTPGAGFFPFAYGNVTDDRFFELRFTSAQDRRLRFEVGVSYYDQEFRNADDFSFSFQDNEAFGIFGTVDFDITDELTLSAEGRWVDDTQSLLDLNENLLPGGESQYQDFMPRVILSYSPTADLNIYASWSQSSLNGVETNAVTFSAALPAELPDPTVVGNFTGIQRLDAYEIGIKQQVADWLSYSIAAYYTEWENQPFNTTFPGGFGLVNLALDGDSEYKGIDFEFTLTPTTGLDVYGSVGYVDTQLNRLADRGSIATLVLCPSALTSTVPCSALGIAGGTISASGNQVRAVEKWSGAGGASYTFPIGSGEAYIRGDAIYRGKRFVDNFEYNQIGSNWRVNLRAGADISDNFALEAFVENLFQDNTLPVAGAIGGTFGPTGGGFTKAFTTLPDRRELGLRLSFDF